MSFLNTLFLFSASSSSLSCLLGFTASSVLMDVYGRKITHALVVLPGIVGWLCIYLANGIPALMIGRILTGISTGATVLLGAIVIGEYSSPKFRGIFLNLKTVFFYMGSTLVHILGHFYTWRTIAIQAMFPNILALIIIYTWPESPAWLASKQQFEKSEKSFYWLQGKSESVTRELETIIKAQITSPKTKQTFTITEKVKEFLMKFTKKDFLKPLMNIVMGIIVLEMSGRHLFPAYALKIVEEITGNKSQSFYYILFIDGTIIASTVFSSILIKIIKRRMLLFSTGLVSFCVLMFVCMYLFLMSRDVIPVDYYWVSIAMSVIYFIAANLGCTPIPLALLGELYPLAHRGAGSAMSGLVMSLCAMGALHMTPYLLDSIKVYGTFAVYGIVMAISLSVLYFTLPETKDKTLQDIEYYFNHGEFMDDKADESSDVKDKMIL